jgi:hypothetical protein
MSDKRMVRHALTQALAHCTFSGNIPREFFSLNKREEERNINLQRLSPRPVLPLPPSPLAQAPASHLTT